MDPFFVLYDSRSGSTLLSRLITKYFNATVAPEADLPINILLDYNSDHLLSANDSACILKLIAQDRKVNDWNINKEIENIVINSEGRSVSQLIEDIYKALLDSVGDANISSLGLKKGSYIRVADRIKSIYNDAQFICIIRDPRGVFSSKKYSIYTGTGKPFDEDPIHAALVWSDYLECVLYLKSIYKDSVHIVKYEDILQDEEKTMKKISGYLDLPIDIQSRPFYIHSRYADIHKNATKSVMKSNDKWISTLLECEISHIQFVCLEKMKEFGYELRPTKRNIYCMLIGWFKIKFYRGKLELKKRYGYYKYDNCFARKRKRIFSLVKRLKKLIGCDL
jgi:hypothetical protein